MLWLLLGDYSAGKTFRLVIESCSEEYKDIEIWGNFKLKLPNYRKIDIMDLEDLGRDKLVLLDEMQTWIESRLSMSYDNLFITNILDQCDKRGVDVFGTAHLFSSLDVRFRMGVHRIIKCSRIGKRPKDWKRKQDFRGFRFIEMNTYNFRETTYTLSYEKAMKYFPLYDTSEIINYPNKKEMVLDLLLKHDSKKASLILKKLAESIIKTRKRLKRDKVITHPNVIKGLLDLGYSPKYEKLVYSLIQDLILEFGMN